MYETVDGLREMVIIGHLFLCKYWISGFLFRDFNGQYQLSL